MNHYEEKQARKLERFENLAEKNEKLSKESYKQSQQMGEAIPFGQPILVGHHSEKRHRNHIEKMNNLMKKSIEQEDKATYYKKKAEYVQNNNVISSDNPDAIKLLNEKLEALEVKRMIIKDTNKKAKAEGKNKMPEFYLKNLAGNIRAVKQRILKLEGINEMPEINETINGVGIKANKIDFKVQLFFDGKPRDEKRTELKRSGFRWSPYFQCWQRQMSKRALYLAREILKTK